MIRILSLSCLAIATLLLAACGQVITPVPTSTPASRATPTPPAPASGASPTTRPFTYMADTATPTITPTPVIHVVQKGDTLQAIAFDFGVSVDALQRVNGVDNPQFLQVGQRLRIPVGEEGDGSGVGLLLPTPTPHPLPVQGVAFYETPVDSLLGLGEIVNTASVTLTNVLVEIVLLDSSGNAVLKADTFAAMDVLPPAARSPFSLLITTPPGDWVGYQVSVIRGQEAGELGSVYVPLKVADVDSSSSGPLFRVTGLIENQRLGQVIESVELFVTTYDDRGSVTGYRRLTLVQDQIEGGLSPGEVTGFTLSLSTHAGMPEDFVVSALGRTAPPTP